MFRMLIWIVLSALCYSGVMVTTVNAFEEKNPLVDVMGQYLGTDQIEQSVMDQMTALDNWDITLSEEDADATVNDLQSRFNDTFSQLETELGKIGAENDLSDVSDLTTGLEEIHTLFEQLYTDACNTVSNGKADMDKEEVTEADVEAMNQKFLDMLDKFDKAVTSVFKDDQTLADSQTVSDAIRDINDKIEFDEESVMSDFESMVNEVAETDEAKALTERVASQIQLIEEKLNEENKAE